MVPGGHDEVLGGSLPWREVVSRQQRRPGTQQDEGREDGTQTSERDNHVQSRLGKQMSWQAEMGEEAARPVPADCTAVLPADMLAGEGGK